ncbi:MAG: starch synthase [Bradymonadia bacterium]|jgi:starch synthase
MAPWSGTGGLADVAGALPAAQSRLSEDNEVAVFSPLYRQVLRHSDVGRLSETGVSVTTEGPPRASAKVISFDTDGPATFFVESSWHFDREGIYDDPRGWVHADNPARFAFLCRAALETAPLLMGGIPDVVHAHDWPAALALLYMRRHYRFAYRWSRAVLTIHNLGYQGVFDKAVVPTLGIPWSDFTMEGGEFHDQLNLLKLGAALADVIVTPSPTYAKEVLGEEQGHGLNEFLAHHSHKLHGILNGVDPEVWNPATDPHIESTFSAKNHAGKAACRTALMREFGLEGSKDTPVLAVVSRLAHQKGLDLLADAAPSIVELGGRIALVGTGDPELAARWQRLADDHPGRISARITFDVPLAHRVEAGADAFLMPSRYEPCGLNQLYSLRYGTLPIVHGVGGLADTVIDADVSPKKSNGFVFAPLNAQTLTSAVDRAIAVFRDEPKRWSSMMLRGMKRDASWAPAAREYLELYEAHPPLM